MSTWALQAWLYLRKSEFVPRSAHSVHRVFCSTTVLRAMASTSGVRVPQWVMDMTDEDLSSQFANLAVAEGSTSVPVTSATRPMVEKKFVRMLQRAEVSVLSSQVSLQQSAPGAPLQQNAPGVPHRRYASSNDVNGVSFPTPPATDFPHHGEIQKDVAEETSTFLLDYCVETCVRTIWGNMGGLNYESCTTASNSFMSPQNMIKVAHEQLRSSQVGCRVHVADFCFLYACGKKYLAIWTPFSETHLFSLGFLSFCYAKLC